jgi:hypothetical protein
VTVVVAVLLVASLPYSPWAPSANRRAAALSAEPTPAAAGPAASTAAAASTIFAWRDGEGVLHRAGIATARYDEFAAAARRQIEDERQGLRAAQAGRLRAALAPRFEEIDGRIPAYASWAFDWWTSWILLARTFEWTWDELRAGPLLTLPDRVQARLVAAVQDQFIKLVMAPQALEPKIDVALRDALAPIREELRADCAKHQQSFDAFVGGEARQVERRDPAQEWVPDPDWASGAATFQPLCDETGATDEAALHAQFPVLLELKNADGPVNDVIVRLARPFATKLISYIALPVIVAAILGGILLPLFGLLPGVLANIITGVLTGALGALIIGFGASASVDWLLNRTDATLNRAGFEVSVGKAVIAAEGDFERRVIEVQERAIDRQMQALATEMEGKTAAP